MADPFKSIIPTRQENFRISPYEASKRVVQAFREAQEELKRRGYRPTVLRAAKLIGPTTSPSMFQLARSHVAAVEVYGISPSLSKQEAVRRMRVMDPLVKRISDDMETAEDKRSDPEILADAISVLIVKAGTQMTQYDAGVLATFLRRDPAKREATLSALIDFKKWLTTLERSLESNLQ